MVYPGEQVKVQDALQQTVMLEGTMVDRNKYGAIRELARLGAAKKEIARQLEVTVKTVRRALKKPQWEPYQRQKPDVTVLSQFNDWATSRAEEVNFNAAIMFRELKEKGYTGGYEMVKLLVRPLREEFQQRVDAVMRFETGPGRQGQVDWGSAQVWLGDHRVRIHFFAMVLGYSRRLFARAYLDERLPTLLAAHQEAFAWFGGRPSELLYDNPKTIVTDHTAMTMQLGTPLRMCESHPRVARQASIHPFNLRDFSMFQTIRIRRGLPLVPSGSLRTSPWFPPSLMLLMF